LITLKTLNEVVQGMIDNIHDKVPKADTKEGTFLRDVFIDPVADEVVGLNFDMKIMETNQSILTATDEDLDRLASNYGITRNEATKSSGFIRFYFKSTDVDTVIYASTVVQTVPTYATASKSFTTTNTKDIYYVSDNTTLDREQYEYYQIINLSNLTLGDSGYYYYDVEALSSDTGSAYNVSANTIIRKSSTLDTNILTFGNTIAFTGGSDNETDISLRMRIRLALLGANIGTKYGYLSYVYNSDYVEDVNVVSAGDADMLRDLNDSYEHSGGMVDIYVKGKKADTATFTSKISLNNLGYTDSYAYTPLVINSKRKPIIDINSITYNRVLSDGTTTTRYLRNASNYDYEATYTNLTELGSTMLFEDADIEVTRLSQMSKIIDELEEKINDPQQNFYDFLYLDSENSAGYIGADGSNLNGYEPEYNGSNKNFNVYSNFLYCLPDTDIKAPFTYAMYYRYLYTENGDITEDQKRYFAIKFSFGVGAGETVTNSIVRDENGVTLYYCNKSIENVEDFSEELKRLEDENGKEIKLTGPVFDDNGYVVTEGTKFYTPDYSYNNEDDCYYYSVDSSTIQDFIDKSTLSGTEDLEQGNYFFYVKFSDDIYSGNIMGDNFTSYTSYEYYTIKQEYILYKDDLGEWTFYTINDDDFVSGASIDDRMKQIMYNICTSNISNNIVTKLTTVDKSIDIDQETYVADVHGYIKEYYGDGETTNDYYEYYNLNYEGNQKLPYKFTVHRNIYNEIIAIDFVFAVEDMVNTDAEADAFYYFPNYEYTIIRCLDTKTKLYIYEKLETPNKNYFKDTKLTYSNFFTTSSTLLTETVEPLVNQGVTSSSVAVVILSDYITETTMQNNILLQLSNYKDKMFNYKSDIDFGNETTNTIKVYNKPYVYVQLELTNDEKIVNVKVYVSSIPNVGIVSCHLIIYNTNYDDNVVGFIDEEAIYSTDNSDADINNGEYLENYTMVDGIIDITISSDASIYYREDKDTCIFERNFYRKSYEKDGETCYSTMDLNFSLSNINIYSVDEILMSYEAKDADIVFGGLEYPSTVQFAAENAVIVMFSITEHIVNSKIYKIDMTFPLSYLDVDYPLDVTFVKKADEFYVRNYTVPDFALMETNSSLYSGSIMSNYRIKWFNPYNILDDTNTIGTNCYITVSYNYNSLIYTLQQKIASVKCLTADVLIKSAEEYPLEILLSVQFDDTQEISDTKTNIIDTLTEQINDNSQLGTTLKKSDIIATVQRMDGVYYVESSETEIRKMHGEAQKIIKLKGNQYFYLRNIAITTIEDTE
jgi:uncharacterized phage protein gp47/JayE